MTALHPAEAGLPAADVWRLRRRTSAVQQGAAVEPSTRVLWGLAALLLTAYAIAFAWLSPLLLQDYPNHLARTWVMSDLVFHHGAQFGQAFRYQFAAIPYILGDLTLVGATELFGISAAAALWSLVVFLSLPCALLFYLRTLSIPSARRALLLILSAFLATDWFFLVGFLEFRLGVAMALVVLGMAEWVRQRPTMARLGTYAGILILGYLTHLTTLVFATAALGTTALLRLVSHRSTWRTECALLAPCGAIFLYHFSSGYAYRAPGDLVEVPFIWDTLKGKLLRLGGEFDRFGRADGALLGALALSLGLYIGRVRLKDLGDPVVLEMLVLAGMFLAMYFALPVGYPEAYYVDIRALPFAFLFVIFAVARSTAARAQSEVGLGEKGRSWEGQRKTLAVLIACALVVANLAYLVKHFRVHRGWLNEYRAVMASIPLHARVLPVYTHGPDGKVVPFLHAFSFAVIDRNAIVPYLQTGDTGNPEKYLRYRNRPYSPAQGWYGDVDAPPVDWRAAVCDYDFLLATKPFDRSRLRVPLTSIAENDSAALFALPGRSACR
jgi:hypothetical protein